MACTKHPGSTYAPDVNFCCKAAYWRANGAPGVHYQQGQQLFHESTVKAEAKQILENCAANGIKNLEPAGVRWV